MQSYLLLQAQSTAFDLPEPNQWFQENVQNFVSPELALIFGSFTAVVAIKQVFKSFSG